MLKKLMMAYLLCFMSIPFSIAASNDPTRWTTISTLYASVAHSIYMIRIHPLCPLHGVIPTNTYSIPLSEAHRVIQHYSVSMIMAVIKL